MMNTRGFIWAAGRPLPETRADLAQDHQSAQVADRHVALDALRGLLALRRGEDPGGEDDEVECLRREALCRHARASRIRLRSALMNSMPGTPASRNVWPTTITLAPRDARKRLKARPRPPVPPTTATFIPFRSRLEGSTRCHVKLLSRFMTLRAFL